MFVFWVVPKTKQRLLETTKFIVTKIIMITTPNKILINSGQVRARLHQASASTQSQRYHDASDTVLIEVN